MTMPSTVAASARPITVRPPQSTLLKTSCPMPSVPSQA